MMTSTIALMRGIRSCGRITSVCADDMIAVATQYIVDHKCNMSLKYVTMLHVCQMLQVVHVCQMCTSFYHICAVVDRPTHIGIKFIYHIQDFCSQFVPHKSHTNLYLYHTNHTQICFCANICICIAHVRLHRPMIRQEGQLNAEQEWLSALCGRNEPGRGGRPCREIGRLDRRCQMQSSCVECD